VKPLGLYVHIPFCAKKCGYCDFPSYEGVMPLRTRYIDKVIEEITSRADAHGHPSADTVYIGGGTPSLLQPEQIVAVLAALRRSFHLSSGCEISCEANPGMLSDRFLAALVRGGVNRLSLGAQSAEAPLLHSLGRQHSWAQVDKAVSQARLAGIDNINIDLMLGIPGQTIALWLHTLESALALDVKHLSCYGLILEEGTPLAGQIATRKVALPEEEEERLMYAQTLDRLSQAGFAQYEISNFARPGFACRHNLNCWKRHDYLGFGSAAHSLEEGRVRRANPQGIEAYLAGEAVSLQEIDKQERMFESLMLGLRMTEGLDLEAFQTMHGEDFHAVYGGKAQASIEACLAGYTNDGHFALTRQGMDVMNTVLLDFM
jgi:oxygen-independent coproporphyrinogen-3 oxidase